MFHLLVSSFSSYLCAISSAASSRCYLYQQVLVTYMSIKDLVLSVIFFEHPKLFQSLPCLLGLLKLALTFAVLPVFIEHSQKVFAKVPSWVLPRIIDLLPDRRGFDGLIHLDLLRLIHDLLHQLDRYRLSLPSVHRRGLVVIVYRLPEHVHLREVLVIESNG